MIVTSSDPATVIKVSQKRRQLSRTAYTSRQQSKFFDVPSCRSANDDDCCCGGQVFSAFHYLSAVFFKEFWMRTYII